MQAIVDSGWTAIPGSNLEQQFSSQPAQLIRSLERRKYSAADFVRLFFLDWLGKHLVPLINEQLRSKSKHVIAKQRIYYHPVSSMALLKYFLSCVLRGMMKHSKTDNTPASLEILADKLVERHIYEAISGVM